MKLSNIFEQEQQYVIKVIRLTQNETKTFYYTVESFGTLAFLPSPEEATKYSNIQDAKDTVAALTQYWANTKNMTYIFRVTPYKS